MERCSICVAGADRLLLAVVFFCSDKPFFSEDSSRSAFLSCFLCGFNGDADDEADFFSMETSLGVCFVSCLKEALRPFWDGGDIIL